MYPLTSKNKSSAATGKVSQNKSSGGNSAAKTAENDIAVIQKQLRQLEASKRLAISRAVNKMPDVSKNDKKIVKKYAMEILHPSAAVDIPRPIPQVSHKGFYSGQLIIDSDADSMSVIVTPDPFNFMILNTRTDANLESDPNFPEYDLANAGANDAGNIFYASVTPYNTTFTYPYPFTWNNGRYCVPQVSAAYGSTDYIALDNNDLRLNRVNCFQNVVAKAGTYPFLIANLGQGTITAQSVLGRVQADGTIIVDYLGDEETISAGETNDSALTLAADVLADTTISGASIFMGVKVNLVSIAGFRWEDLVMIPSVLFESLDSTVTTRVYTIGEASYPGNSARAEQLDQMFSECMLYAPVAASTVINVTQVLRDRGGNFLAAYLPSNLAIPTDPDLAWNDIKSYSRSYPVKSQEFMLGAHATWVGARIQDYEFRRPFRQEFWQIANWQSLPKTVLIAQRAKSADSSVARYYIDFRAAFAIQTLDPRIELTLSPSCPNFCALFLSLVVNHDLLVGENPDHLKRLLELATKIANDPRVEQLAKFGLTKVLPSLMAALV